MNKKKRPEEYIHDIQKACAALGWCIAMNDTTEIVSGLIIGENRHVDGLLKNLENGHEYQIWQKAAEDTQLH